MVILIDKRVKLARIFVSKKDAGFVMGVHSATIRDRLPYWEDSDWILSEADIEKSGRGTNNLPNNK